MSEKLREPFPEAIFETLGRHGVEYVVVGGIAALMHDSPYPTFDTDVCPASDDGNLKRLTAALKEMNARIFTESEPDGLPFALDARFISDNPLLNLVTDHGRLDVILEPAGSQGYPDLRRDALVVQINDREVRVASLADVIRTKAAVPNRLDPSLPVLRELLARKLSAKDG